MRCIYFALGLVFLLIISGCSANYASIDRSTPLNGKTVDGNEIEGIAVHMDAQQRAVIQSGLGYCAEPSPDAISAIASSISLSGANSSAKLDAASSLATSVGSIGLRTQSIQLMRDALYRLCEAINNGAISQTDMAMLLHRSQDLTAVVVAVEQLTGTVVVPPVVITPKLNESTTDSEVTASQIPVIVQQKIDPISVQKVSNAVKSMVDQVLKKEYIIQHCMTVLSNKDSDIFSENRNSVFLVCRKILESEAEKILGMKIYGSSARRLRNALDDGSLSPEAFLECMDVSFNASPALLLLDDSRVNKHDECAGKLLLRKEGGNHRTG